MTRFSRVLMVLIFSGIALVGCGSDKTVPAHKTSTDLAQWEPKTDEDHIWANKPVGGCPCTKSTVGSTSSALPDNNKNDVGTGSVSSASSDNSKDNVDVSASSHSSSNSGAVVDTSVSTSGGHGSVTETISETESTFWKCGAPTVKVTKRAYMTRHNGQEVSHMAINISFMLMDQGYHLYKRPCSRGQQAQDRFVQITVE
jgi:hypothetical protein